MTEQESKPTGLFIMVVHPASTPELYKDYDEDGYMYHFGTDDMTGPQLIELYIKQGMGTAMAAETLRKIAEMIERHGQQLLNLPKGKAGLFRFDDNGTELEFRDPKTGEKI